LKFRLKNDFSIINGDPTWHNKDTEPVNAQEFAAKLVKHQYREGWSIPDMPM